MSHDMIMGLVTGIVFGVLLQRAGVIRYGKQLAALRLRDMTILKFMLSTICVAMIGTYLLVDLGMAKLSIKPTILGGVVIGGALFGVGWAIFGYCPGTAMGALGEGRLDTVFGLAGMLVGAGIYAEIYPLMKNTVLTWGDYGKITIPQVLGVNHWIVIAVFVAGTLALFRWFEKKGL